MSAAEKHAHEEYSVAARTLIQPYDAVIVDTDVARFSSKNDRQALEGIRRLLIPAPNI